jgi:hypothetical protein
VKLNLQIGQLHLSFAVWTPYADIDAQIILLVSFRYRRRLLGWRMYRTGVEQAIGTPWWRAHRNHMVQWPRRRAPWAWR